MDMEDFWKSLFGLEKIDRIQRFIQIISLLIHKKFQIGRNLTFVYILQGNLFNPEK